MSLQSSEVFNPITEEELQELIDCVTVCAGEKAKYTATVNPRMRRHAAWACTFQFHKTGRRKIEFAKSELHAQTNRLIQTICHEIAHFKECEKGRHKLLTKYPFQNPGCFSNGMLMQTYGYSKHKAHTKRFDRIFHKLLAKVESVYGEKLS